MVLTGGTSNLSEIRKLAREVTGLPVRTAKPENLIGLVDQLHSPAYSTSIGILKWALMMNETVTNHQTPETYPEEYSRWEIVIDWIKRLLP